MNQILEDEQSDPLLDSNSQSYKAIKNDPRKALSELQSKFCCNSKNIEKGDDPSGDPHSKNLIFGGFKQQTAKEYFQTELQDQKDQDFTLDNNPKIEENFLRISEDARGFQALRNQRKEDASKNKGTEKWLQQTFDQL